MRPAGTPEEVSLTAATTATTATSQPPKPVTASRLLKPRINTIAAMPETSIVLYRLSPT